MNHKFPKLDSEVVSVHGRDLCGKCNSLCCSKCHVCSLELYGAVWSCMELYGAVLPWHSHLNHLIHPSSSSSQISQVGCDDGTQLHGNSGCPGGALVRGSMRCCNRFCKVQGSRLCLLEFIVTYMTCSDHWPRRKGLEDLRARYPEVIQEVLQCRVPFPLMTLMRGELTWLVASNY